MPKYTDELTGQTEFYNKLSLSDDVNIDNNTDGYIDGTLFEFKLSINSLDAVLFQAIKYLSHFRVIGKPIPKNIILVSLNQETAYCYNSADYLPQIEQVYAGSASTNNANFVAGKATKTIKYGTANGLPELLNVINYNNPQYTKINIDELCVIGWSSYYYENATIGKNTKVDFFNELKRPSDVLGSYINPWKGNEDDFKYIMDALNDPIHRKELGAFYTPPAYAKKATELVRETINRIPENRTCKDENCEHRFEGEQVHKHYIILDRCAGTGNLEEFFSDEEFSHTIVATYEFKEWVVLNSRIGNKVKMIIPPVAKHQEGLLNGGDALSEHFVLGKQGLPDPNGEIFGLDDDYYAEIDKLNGYVKDESCNVIMYENPPYRDVAAREKNKNSSHSYVYESFVKNGTGHSAHRDLSNLFCWSGYNYYLKSETDFLILYCPVKYWKSLGLSQKKFINGFLFNRKHFHATPSSISCILWQNIDDITCEIIKLESYDIDEDKAKYLGFAVDIRKCHKSINEYRPVKKYAEDTKSLVFCELSGEQSERYTQKTPVYNENIVGYLRSTSFNLDANSWALTRTITYDALEQHYGFYLRSDNYLEKLPLLCAKLYPQKNWYEKDVYFTTADGGDAYTKEAEFLKSCFIFTCLTKSNHILSFDGSDNRRYLNELCFDDNTLASQKRAVYERDDLLNTAEKSLLAQFDVILEEAKKTKNYNPNFKYGVYQIDRELNTFTETVTGNGKKAKKIKTYDYPSLNGKFTPLRNALNDYYEQYIQPKLFEYELLK